MIKKIVVTFFSLFIVLIIVSIIYLCIGSDCYSLWQIVEILKNPDNYPAEYAILMDIRFPRLFLAILTGAGLSVAGSAFQAILRNPLADPYIIGTSSGASLGAVISVILHISWISFVSPMILFAFLGASFVMLFVYNVSVKMGKLSVENFLLSGVIAGSFCSALVSFLMMFSGESLPHIVMWLMGGFSGREEWNYVLMLLPYVILGFIFLLFHSPALNLLSMGEDIASSRGVNVEKEKLAIIACASLITSVSVSIAGTIGFIGFMIPHIMRKIFGSENRILIISSVLGGAIFLTLADMLARSILPQGAEIPVGVITSLIGAPFFFFVLKKR